MPKRFPISKIPSRIQIVIQDKLKIQLSSKVQLTIERLKRIKDRSRLKKKNLLHPQSEISFQISEENRKNICNH